MQITIYAKTGELIARFKSVEEFASYINSSGEGEVSTLEECVAFMLECEYGYRIEIV